VFKNGYIPVQHKTKRLQLIFILYWCMLLYIIAALVWWYIELSGQNDSMTVFKTNELNISDPYYEEKTARIESEKKRKFAQYAGEGATFLLVIVAGAVFLYRAVRKQLKLSQQQQNFMIAITHELKTPIAVARLNLETIKKRKLGENIQDKLLQNTLEEVNRLNSLCNNLLLSSRIESEAYTITKEEINFSSIVSNCVNDFRNRFPQRQINVSVQENILIDGDEFLVEMAVNNLLENAIKYSSKHTTVDISLSAQNNNAHLLVKDQGTGIADEEKSKVFGKFYRAGNEATKSARGTGLGLFLVDRVVRSHHGQISLSDNQPTGTAFEVVLKTKS
jgi:two-component system, OmpR family, sensor histidine kinase CiaH